VLRQPIRKKNVSHRLQLLKKLENFFRKMLVNSVKNIWDLLECIFRWTINWLRATVHITWRKAS